ncbi:MATE family efflux transporter [Halomarina ordinaria]|uniref:MATE family efflux transporter n=1 Tax=Halomarina ordinaria TaxID=3033939 RepID=A0ABD5U3W0_9EURY|nr:MATE family efflux transporter [Halomarina sp. PSRA2]
MSIRDHLRAIFDGREELDLTSGSIARPLLYLSVPIVITNLLQTAYNLADTFWLGQYSTNALAAITFAFPMVFLLIALALGLSVAGSVLVAQHTGAGEDRKAEYAASQTIGFTVVVSLVLGGIGFFLVEDFLRVLGAAPEVVPLATRYMQVYCYGLLSVFGFAVFISLMRGYGDTVTPMLVMFGSVVLNIALDPILIFGFENNPLFGYLGLRGLESTLFALTGYAGSGIAGASIATVFSRSLAFLVGLAILFQGTRGVRIRVRDLVPERRYARRLVDIGLPASIEGTGRALSVNLLLFIIAAFPTTVVAAYGIGTRVFSVIFLPAIAFSQGVETMTGQNIGAKEPDRAARANDYGAKVMLVTLTALGVLIFLGAGPISAVFTDDPAVVDASAEFLRVVAPTFGFIGVMRSYSGGFRGAGKTLIAAGVSIAMLAGIRLPLAWVATGWLGEFGLWVAFAVSNVAGGLLAYLWFRRGTWRDVDLTSRSPGPRADPAGDD